jgi:hypothetical protein
MMKKLLTRGLMGVAALAVPAGALMALPMVAASAAPSPGWHVGYLNSSGQALSMGQAAPLSGGGATFNFTNQPNTALLLNTKGGGTDLTSKTVTATVQTTGVSVPVSYRGQPDACGGASSVRLYFETSNAGGFNETNYWWANDPEGLGSVSLDTLNNNPTTLTVSLNPSNWTDWNGHRGSDLAYQAGFQKAVGNVTGIGLSFGGGCFFENGVGTNGTGSFQLSNLTTTP